MPRAPILLYDLSQHPEYAAVVGEIVALWSMIELRLSLLFSFLLRAPPWTAWAAWFSLFNSKARQEMVRSLAGDLDDELPEKEQLIELISRVAKAPAARHGYAHKPWLLMGDKLYQLDLPSVPIEKSKRHHVSLKRMKEERDALRALQTDLNEFVMYFGNKYPMAMDPHLTQLPMPWPGKLPTRGGHPSRSNARRP